MQYKIAMLTLGSLLVTAMPAAAASAPDNGVAAKPAKEKTYCLQFGVDTGSRINRVACKTKREWAMLGVDVDEIIAK